MTLDVVKTTPVVAPQAQLNIGADFKIAPPPGGEIYGHLDARDPVTGAKKWEVRFPEPPLASVLSTGGNLVFVPDSRGTIHAYDAEIRAPSCGITPTAPAIRAASSATPSTASNTSP